MGAGVGGCRRDGRCVGARDRVHLGDVEDVGDAVAETGCGVGVGFRCGVALVGEEHRRVDRDALLALADLVAGLVPGAVALHAGGVGALREDQHLVGERVLREAAHGGEQRQERLAGLGEALSERREQVVDRAAGFGVHLGGSLSESGPHGPFARRSGDRGRPTREPATPTPDGARNAARAGRVTAAVLGRGALARVLRRGAPEDQREAGAKMNGEARGESPAHAARHRSHGRGSAAAAGRR